MIDRFELFTSYISDIYRHIQKIERDVMESYGLKGPHVQCLVAMSRQDQSVTAAQLSSLCEKDKAAISRTLSEMVQEGLVIREGQGSYRAALRLTEKGAEIARQVNQKVHLAVSQAGEGLSESDRETLYTALGCICTNLKQMSKEGLSI